VDQNYALITGVESDVLLLDATNQPNPPLTFVSNMAEAKNVPNRDVIKLHEEGHIFVLHMVVAYVVNLKAVRVLQLENYNFVECMEIVLKMVPKLSQRTKTPTLLGKMVMIQI